MENAFGKDHSFIPTLKGVSYLLRFRTVHESLNYRCKFSISNEVDILSKRLVLAFTYLSHPRLKCLKLNCYRYNK